MRLPAISLARARPRVRAGAILVAAALLAAGPAPSGVHAVRAAPAATNPPAPPADPSAPWRRLERIGVSPGLRPRVMEAAHAAAARLLALQREDGTFVDAGAFPHREDTWGAGINALAGWALAALESEESFAAARRTADWLATGDSVLRREPHTQVYTAGAAINLFLGVRGWPRATDRLASDLAQALDAQSGYWGYHTLAAAAAPVPGATTKLKPGRAPNLSTSQFAVLGLRAAEMVGTKAPSTPWRRHLETLVSRQTPQGSWPYEPGLVEGFRGGTFAGLANLAVAREALEATGPLDRTLANRATRAGTLARDLLEADGPDFLWDLRHGPPDAPPHAVLTAFGLEAACVLAGTGDLAGEPWADALLEALLARRNGDGSFGPGTQREFVVVETSLGLLTLVAAPEMLRLTPGTAPPAPAGGAASAPVPLDDGRDAAERTLRLLGDGSASPAALLATLEFLGRALAAPDPAAVPPAGRAAALEAFRARAGEAVLAALVAERPSGDGNALEGVNLRAAALLGRAEVPADGRLLAALRLGPLRREAPAGNATVLRAQLAVAAARAGPAALPLLLDLAEDTDAGRERRLRARAALQALPRIAGLAPGARRAAAVRLVKAWRSVEVASTDTFPASAAADGGARWRFHRPWVLDALEALVTDARTGAPPRDARGFRLASVAAFDDVLEPDRGRR